MKKKIKTTVKKKDEEQFCPEGFPGLFFIYGLAVSALNLCIGDIFGLIIGTSLLIPEMIIFYCLIKWFNYELDGKIKKEIDNGKKHTNN